MSGTQQPTDLELVALARLGNRDAFGLLVSRHQTLVTSLAYGICGDFARSDDIAQEAFVSAWRQLSSLDDASKFKPWLCGIARNLARNFTRQLGRRPDRLFEAGESSSEPADYAPGPREQAVTREEAAIVWQTLEKLPIIYREPLILFYREHQTVERVATALDLSTDSVKQRLSRGRAMMRDNVERLVERSLGFTTPGVLFTTSVLGAISAIGPVLIASNSVAAAATAANGAAAAKTAVALPGFLMFAAPLVSLAAVFFARRQALRYTRSEVDRTFVKRLWAALGIIIVMGPAGVFARIGWLRSHPAGNSQLSATLFQMWLLLILAGLVILALWAWRPFVEWGRNIRLPENASPWQKRFWFGPDRALAYRSNLTWLGLPLLDIRFGFSPEEPLVRGTARGWIAIGDIAYGVFAALGGVAVGGIAIGAMGIGLFSTGGISVGVVALGGVAIGGTADGLIAVGYTAAGVLMAVGFESAVGYIAIAKHIAIGPIFAMADHVRDSVARQWLVSNPISGANRAPLSIAAPLLLVLSNVAVNWLIRRPARQIINTQLKRASDQ